MLNLVSKPSSTFLFVHKIYYVSILLPEKNPVKSFRFHKFKFPTSNVWGAGSPTPNLESLKI